MVKINNTRHQHKINKLIKTHWQKTENKLKLVFRRSVLKIGNMTSHTPRKTFFIVRFFTRLLKKRKIIKIKQSPYPLTPASGHIFSANPDKVRYIIQECEALKHIFGDLQESEHAILEKAQQVNLMKSFLAVLNSQTKEPTVKQYTTFLQLKSSVEYEVFQTKTLLQKQADKLKQNIKNISSPSKQYTCSSRLHAVMKQVTKILSSVSMNELINSTAYKTYLQVKDEIMSS